MLPKEYSSDKFNQFLEKFNLIYSNVSMLEYIGHSLS
jgi:hypothetical protein